MRYRRDSNWFLILVLGCFSALLPLHGEVALYPDLDDRRESPAKTTYFIDPVAGSDKHSGTSEDRPWKTFLPINRIRLSAGCRVVIRPGAFQHTLSIAGIGSEHEPIEIRFLPGRYDIDPKHARRETYAISNTNADPEGMKAVGIHLIEARHVRIHGKGAVLHARGKLIHVCIDHCVDVGIEGVAFDYHRPTVSEFRVADVGDDQAILRVHQDSPYQIVGGEVVWKGEGWEEKGGLGQELDLESGRVHRMRDPLGGLKVTEVAPAELRVEGKHRFKKNKIYQIRNPFRDYCGAFTRNSRDISWRDVHFRFIHGMGIVTQFTENLTLDRVRVEPAPESGRTTAAWADCVQASGCRGRILIRDCVFSGAHDDAINIHGTHLRIISSDPGKRQLEVQFVHKQTWGFPAFFAGDQVAFVRWDSLGVFGENEADEAEMVDPRTMRLVLANPLPESIRDDDVLENVTWTPEVEIYGCTVRHIPTRGFLCTTRRNVVIKDNDFHATHMPGILIENDASGWFESGCVRDMLIRNNRFHECGEPVIHINPRNSVPNPSVHRNIRIENNRFQLRNRIAVGAHSTEGLKVAANRIVSKVPLGERGWLEMKHCKDAVIGENTESVQ